MTDETYNDAKLISRNDIFHYIDKRYGASPEYLWAKFPRYAVFRHSENNKCFAAVMDVKLNKLGLAGDNNVDILNLKCGSLMTGSLLSKKGCFPAYHMNKDNWISVLLDGSVNKEDIRFLIDLSYKLTKNK